MGERYRGTDVALGVRVESGSGRRDAERNRRGGEEADGTRGEPSRVTPNGKGQSAAAVFSERQVGNSGERGAGSEGNVNLLPASYCAW